MTGIKPSTGLHSRLKRYRAAAPTPTATALEKALAERMPERPLSGILARTGHWLEWWRRFGPASGSDPKLPDAFFRYTLTTFTYGRNLGPAQAARHMAGVSARELGATFRRHMSIGKLNKAIADVVDAFTELDLVRAWGDGATVLVPVRQPRDRRRQRPGGAGEGHQVAGTLLANCLIFHTVVDMTTVIRELIAEGWQITGEDLAVLSPYLTAHIQRFGVYATDEVALAPDAYNAYLGVEVAPAAPLPAV